MTFPSYTRRVWEKAYTAIVYRKVAIMNLLTLENLARTSVNEYKEVRYTKQRFHKLNIDWAIQRFRDKRL